MTQNSLRIGGAVIFHTLGEWTDRAHLKDGLDAIGLGDFAPEPRTNASALKDALNDVFSASMYLVRPLETKDGFTVVKETRGIGHVGNTYQTELSAAINDQSQISFHPTDSRAHAIVEKYNTHLGLVRGTQVSSSLVSILASLGGTRLRPTGAIYWLADSQLGRWEEVVKVVEGAGVVGAGCRNACYILRHDFDADSVRAVRDAIVADVTAEAARINKEIESGNLGERALAHRQEEAVSLQEKVREYEALLGVGLASLHEQLEEAGAAACRAKILSSCVEQVA